MSWLSPASAILLVPVSFAIGWIVTGLGVAIALRRARGSAGLPWTERARRLYPSRRVAALTALTAGFALGAYVVSGEVTGIARGRPAVPWAVASGLAGILGGLDVAQRLERRICRPKGGAPAAGVAYTWISLVLLFVPLALMLALMPVRWGWGAVGVLALGTAMVTLNNRYAGWLSLLRWVKLVRPASERLDATVARAVERVGMRPRAVFELSSPNANALALPVTRSLVFTTAVLSALDDAELAAVAVHELGHLAEPRAVYLTRVAASYLIVVCVAAIPLGGSFGFAVGLFPPLIFLAGMLAFRKVGRKMEERSDRLGREHEGNYGGTYARALEKIYEANLIPVVLREKRVHPDLYDRLLAAGVTPSFERPSAPPRELLGALPAILLLAFVFWGVFQGPRPLAPRSEPVMPIAYSHWNEARRLIAEGRLDQALDEVRLAIESDRSNPWLALQEVTLLEKLDRLDEAEIRLGRLERLVAADPGSGDPRYRAFWDQQLRPLRTGIREHRGQVVAESDAPGQQGPIDEAARGQPLSGPPRTSGRDD